MVLIKMGPNKYLTNKLMNFNKYFDNILGGPIHPPDVLNIYTQLDIWHKHNPTCINNIYALYHYNDEQLPY